MFKFLFLLFVVCWPTRTFASVVINEIAWMGTKTSANDEWIELRNNSNSTINLKNWKIIAKNKSLEIYLKETIPSQGFYLLERTDESTLPDILANQIYKGALTNKGEYLQLIDPKNNVIDEVDCSRGWFRGDNETKQTMERKNPESSGQDPDSWQTSQDPGGTPKAKNSIGTIQSSKEPTLKPEVQPKKPYSKTYLSGIVINEIIPSPAGEDKLEEWLEILNKNNEEIDLSGWKIQDTKGAITTYTFPEGTLIGPKGFLILARPTTKITLNNDGDSLNLIQPNGEITDTVTYEKAIEGESYNRTESGWAWSATLTPGSTNIVASPFKEKGTQESQTKKELAAVGEQFPESSDFLYTLSIALGLSISSGAIILALKKKIRSRES